MMLKRITILLLTILMAVVVGCGDMLNAQAAKDRDLGHVVEENLLTSPRFMDNIVSFELEERGVYKCKTTGLVDAQEVGNFGWNVMVVLDERNNTKVKCGRSEFTINGWQDGTQIFKVTISAGARPTVTLMGPFEDETFVAP